MGGEAASAGSGAEWCERRFVPLTGGAAWDLTNLYPNEAAWEAERKARKAMEKALFQLDAERLRRIWDDPLPPR